MKLTLCPNNHYYNADKFPYCPHCNNAKVIVANDNSPEQNNISTEKIIPLAATEEPFLQKLTAGWLVCLNGVNRGLSYPVYNTDNHIGRNSNMDIIIKNEKTISRENHAILSYDEHTDTYSICPGRSVNPTLLNEILLINEAVLHDRDLIQLGECQLLFVRLCDDRFSW